MRLRFIPNRHPVLVAAALLWVVAVGAGTASLWAYTLSPGIPAAAPGAWPAESRLRSSDGRPKLLVVLHPRCPCSRATLRELAVLVARADGRLAVTALFVRPEPASGEWVESDLWRTAATIPGVERVVDHAGEEAKRFGAVTSGQTILYGADGRLLFSGGITPSRGHSGDNRGRSAILRILDDGRGLAGTPVFGCHLQSSARQSRNQAGSDGATSSHIVVQKSEIRS